MQRCIVLLFCALLFHRPVSCSDALKNHIIPLKDVAPGIGLDDLQPLESILRETSVIALGEATHGTREFFQMKQRMLEYCVQELGCTLFGIEASYTKCLPINDYVLYGKGNVHEVVSGQGFGIWNTLEVVEMVEWMRTYNQTVPDEKKVRFLGFDCQSNEEAGKLICDLLKEGGSDYSQKADHLLQLLETQNRFSTPDIAKIEEIRASIQEVKEPIIAFSQRWKGSQNSYEEVCFLIRVLEQEWDFRYDVQSNEPESYDILRRRNSILSRVHEKYPVLSEDLTTVDDEESDNDDLEIRDLYMAENIIALKNRYAPHSSMVIWAHNDHIALNTYGTSPSMGFHLKNKLGFRYYSLGFTTASGTFRAGNLDANDWWNLQVFTLPRQPEDSWAHFCKTLDNDKFILDFRSAPEHDWFTRPSDLITIGGAFSAKWPAEYYIDTQVPNERFDGLIYLETTTASRPAGIPNEKSTK